MATTTEHSELERLEEAAAAGLADEEGRVEADLEAAALGCQVVGLHPGQDLSSALSRDIGAGSGRR